MSFRDYSVTPGSNTTIAGINIAENCSPAGLNDVVRQLAADGRSLTDEIDAFDLSVYQTKAAAVFSGTQPTYDGRGAYLHHANSANVSGKIFITAEGAAQPSMASGDLWFTFS